MRVSQPILAAVFGSALLCVADAAEAQNYDATLTDPQAIAQECGGDAALGAPHFEANCAACHSLTAEEAARPGPHLAGIYGRPAAGLEGYSYSASLSQVMQIWEGESLHRLLSGEIAVPDHPVLADDQMRRDLLTYLRLETRPAPPAPEDVVVPAEVLALEGDAAWGEYLSGDCVSCHNAASVTSGAGTRRNLSRSCISTVCAPCQTRRCNCRPCACQTRKSRPWPRILPN